MVKTVENDGRKVQCMGSYDYQGNAESVGDGGSHRWVESISEKTEGQLCNAGHCEPSVATGPCEQGIASGFVVSSKLCLSGAWPASPGEIEARFWALLAADCAGVVIRLYQRSEAYCPLENYWVCRKAGPRRVCPYTLPVFTVPSVLWAQLHPAPFSLDGWLDAASEAVPLLPLVPHSVHPF